MNTHCFVDGVIVQRFCLTLLGEARLWYHLLEPLNVDWQGLQNLFRQQYLKVGNTWEHYSMHRDPLIVMKIQRLQMCMSLTLGK